LKIEESSEYDMAQGVWYLKKFSIFNKLDEQALKQLHKSTTVREFKAKELIALSDEVEHRIYFLIKGKAKISLIDPKSGKELILYLLKPGDIFGILSMADENYSDAVVRALENCSVGSIPEHDFRRLMDANPNLLTAVNKLVGMRLVKIQNRLEELLFRDVPSRLARLILRLADEFPVELADAVKINLRLTQSDMANLIGATREITSLTINEFKREGWIAIRRRYIYIHDKKALRKLAE